MGSSTDAHCFACGYETLLQLGGGMRTHRTFVSWPVSCKSCQAVTTANVRERPLLCRTCRSSDVLPMDDASVWQGDGGATEAWGDLVLTDGHYRCPKCRAFALRFGATGYKPILWD